MGTSFTPELSSVRGGNVNRVQHAHLFEARTPRGVDPNDNFGVGLAFDIQNDAEEMVRMGELNFVAADVSDATEDSYFEGRTMAGGALGHFDIRSKDLSSTYRMVKINSRTGTITSGDFIGLEVGPRQGATTTGEVRAIHAKPNLSDTFGAGSMTGVFSEVWMRGTGGGTVTTTRAFYAKILDDSDSSGSGTKTYTNPVAALWAEANIGAGNTFSGKMPVINVVKGPYYDWDALVRFSETSLATKACFVGAMTAKNPESDTEAGYISIYVGSTRYEIPFYAVA